MKKLSVIAAFGAALVLASSCSSTKKENPYKGVMSDRGSVPPAYAMNNGKVQSLKDGAAFGDEVPAPTATIAEDDAFVAGPADEPLMDAPAPAPADVVAPAPAADETLDLQGDSAAVAAEAPVEKESRRKFPVIENGRTPSKGLAGKGAAKGGKGKASSGKSAVAPTAGGTYVVKKGDVLSKIAAAHGVKVADIMALNPKVTAPNKIFVGQELVMPGSAAASAVSAAAPAKSVSMSGKEPIPADGMYTVAANDSLWKIGHRFGVSSSDIRTWNGLTSDRLQVGQQLKLRGDGAAAAPAPAPAPAAPVAPVTAAPVAPAPAPAAATEVPPAPVEVPANTLEPAPVIAPAASNFMDYAVVEGDTIDSICGSFELERASFLKDNPQITSDADLKPGMNVRVMLR